MHNLTLQKMGLNYVYLPFPIRPDQLEDMLKAMRVLNLCGLNVTIPFKEMILKYLDQLSPLARDCGAVNVVKNDNGKLVGYNTDGLGFIASLQERGIPLKGRALFIGAGGAARAVAWALATNGISHLDFLDRDEARAREMAERLINRSYSAASHPMSRQSFADLSRQADFIINATPVGMFPGVNAAPVDNLDGVLEHCVICDLIYHPIRTLLLKMGEQKGLRTVSGVSMFVHQGALTLELWTGRKPPLDYMREVVLDALER